MGARVLFRCDGAQVPREWRQRNWDRRDVPINSTGSKADLTLVLENMSKALLGPVSPRAADLVKISAYVYAADQAVSRGGDANVFLDAWRREFGLCIGVNEPEFWGDPKVQKCLCEALGFVSDDTWHFSFSKAYANDTQLAWPTDPAQVHQYPDSVVLFSGGMDSLCATVEAVTQHRARPVLVRHTPTSVVNHRQHELVEQLRKKPGGWSFPDPNITVHLSGARAEEGTQRTRSFLFASLGAATADGLDITRVMLADNGVTSVNLPITDQLIGATATRSTHPKFISLFNGLLKHVFPQGIEVDNPLWSRTRAEGLEALKAAGVEALLQETISCANTRGLPDAQRQCGVCSQCVDRRFAAVAADMEEHDLPERYQFRLFSDEFRDEDEMDKRMVISYYRFARLAANTHPDDYPYVFSELQACAVPEDPTPSVTLSAVIDMHRRHGRAVLNVLGEQIAGAASLMASGRVPVNSLVYIAAADADGLRPAARTAGTTPPRLGIERFDLAPNGRAAWWNGEKYTFARLQAKVIQGLNAARLKGWPGVPQKELLQQAGAQSDSLHSLFKNHKAWGTLIVPGEAAGTYRLAV